MRQPAQWREPAVIVVAFVATRLALRWAGFPFDFSLDWMWLSDPADLQLRLVQTVYYFHAFPPGMNLLTGILLKLGGGNAAALALVFFWALGLVIAFSLYYLLRAGGVSARAALFVTVAFSLLPQSLYFEHLYLYEQPVAAMLCLSVVLFHAALTRQSPRLWLACFTVCALIGMTRSTFHLLWFALMLGAALFFSRTRATRRIVAAAVVPATLLLALYVKNLAVFDTFSAFTYGPSSYAHVTVSRLPPEVRTSWVREHKLSPFAALSPYAGPREYLQVFTGGPSRDWPSQLTQLDRPSVHAPNFNHWVILEANRRRGSDAWYYLLTQPLGYLGNVARGLRDVFTPSTRWHPYTGTERSPHHGHRRVLGAYEDSVNRIVHGFPFAPIGLYALLPLVMIWSASHARHLVRSGDAALHARGAMVWLCLLNVAFVVAVSSAFTFLESSRYRYQVESLIWVLAAIAATALVERVGRQQPKRKTVSARQFP